MASTDEKKQTTKTRTLSKPDQAVQLLAETIDLLSDIGGKQSEVWQEIANRVSKCLAYVERYK